MAKFLVHQYETYLTSYEVESLDLQDAIHQVRTGGGKQVFKEYMRADESYGMAVSEFTDKEWGEYKQEKSS